MDSTNYKLANTTKWNNNSLLTRSKSKNKRVRVKRDEVGTQRFGKPRDDLHKRYKGLRVRGRHTHSFL
jgi:hypothetical protein